MVYDEGYDLFRVRLLNPDGSVKQEQDGIYLNGLVSTIDNMVEKTEDYASRGRSQYGLSLTTRIPSSSTRGRPVGSGENQDGGVIGANTDDALVV